MSEKGCLENLSAAFISINQQASEQIALPHPPDRSPPATEMRGYNKSLS